MSSNQRMYYIDWLRVIAFGLLFVFHSFRLFDTYPWHLKNAETSISINYIIERAIPVVAGSRGFPEALLVVGGAAEHAGVLYIIQQDRVEGGDVLFFRWAEGGHVGEGALVVLGVELHRRADAPQVVEALDLPGARAQVLGGGQEQADEAGGDGHDHEDLDQGPAAPTAVARGDHRWRNPCNCAWISSISGARSILVSAVLSR